MRPVDPKIVDHLNDALTFELSVVNTYFLHARMLDSWGFSKLGKVFYDLSIDEMRDADALITRILFFEGHPNIQRLHSLHVGEDAEESVRTARQPGTSRLEGRDRVVEPAHRCTIVSWADAARPADRPLATAASARRWSPIQSPAA